MARFCSACWLALTGFLACGGQQSTRSATPVTPVPPAVAIVADEPPDLSPVAPPVDLIVRGRFDNPRRATELISSWAKLPIPLAEVVAEQAPAIAAAIDWQAPLELAIALDPRGEGRFPAPLAVASIGLSSVSDAVSQVRAAGASARRVVPGVFRTNFAEPLTCAIAVSLGKAPARLVCGERWTDVEALLGYATRGLPAEQLGAADLVVEAGFEPLVRRYGRDLAGARLFLGLALRQIQLDSPRFDRALADLAYALADELLAVVSDLDRLRIEAVLDAQNEELSLSAAVAFKGHSSWLVQNYRERRMGPAPAELYRMPADMNSGAFGFQGPRERVAPLARALAELAEGYLEARKLPRAGRERWGKLVERAFTLGSTWVTGSGDLPEPAGADRTRNALAKLGWRLVHVSERVEDVKGFLLELVAVLEDSAFHKLLEHNFGVDDAVLPKFKKRVLSLPRFKGQALLVEMSAKAGLGAPFSGFLDGSGLSGQPAKLVIVIVADARGTWIGIGPDEKRLLGKLGEISPDGSRGHEPIRRLERIEVLSGGFFTLSSLLHAYAFFADGRGDGFERALPGGGASPVFSLTGVEREGEATRVHTRLAVPRAVFSDLSVLAPLLASGGLGIAGPASP